jgi:hypothetical protein
MTLEVVSATLSTKPPVENAGPRGELVRRVAASATFEKSPRLRAFFLHVCRCALQNKPEEATEQQIGIYVYGKAPGYNPNDDNIVRSQARVLRMKLEHHFANEGQGESLIITIPKGQYLPVFGSRAADKALKPEPPAPQSRKIYGLRWLLLVPAFLVVLWTANLWLKPRLANLPPVLVSTVTGNTAALSQRDVEVGMRTALPPAGDDIRIAAGRTGVAYVDVWGHQWGTDRDFDGGVAKPGPKRFFPPVPDKGLFATVRQAISADPALPEWQREFQYHIPLNPGVYELRLYFADPLRLPEEDQKEDSQNVRHIVVEVNGNPLLVDLDPIADAGHAAVDVRVFKDVSPSDDGKLHLEFRSRWGQPAFVSAIELRPGTPGTLRPIRISTHVSDFTDTDGTRWSGDNYFVDGRTSTTPAPRNGPKIPLLYNTERHGNFSYSIPVVPGTYTVRLHFMETFFSPLIPVAFCHGAGCRVFDVTCNGVSLLQDFDIYQAASGAFRPVIREFSGIHPNGQGKLLLSFSPRVNYAEVRAIEVIEEPN